METTTRKIDRDVDALIEKAEGVATAAREAATRARIEAKTAEDRAEEVGSLLRMLRSAIAESRE